MAFGLRKITRESCRAIDRRMFPHLKGGRLIVKVVPNDKLPAELRGLLKNGGLLLMEEARITPDWVEFIKNNPERAYIDYEKRKIYHVILACGPTHGSAISFLLDFGLADAHLEPIID